MSAGKRAPRNNFTREEDGMLARLVGVLGEDAWTEVAPNMAGRTARQCRERWKHYLSPVLSHAEWSAGDESALIEHVARVGRKWLCLASMFPGRTDIDLRNRFNKLIQHSRKSESQGARALRARRPLAACDETEAAAAPPNGNGGSEPDDAFVWPGLDSAFDSWGWFGLP